mmetsp:Transcript_22729/g.72814  ORF Transcript_22729/g.72814 Transcript_22729/m.72814 type:complete len:230 (+) Transcript_22729:277-966(+)
MVRLVVGEPDEVELVVEARLGEDGGLKCVTREEDDRGQVLELENGIGTLHGKGVVVCRPLFLGRRPSVHLLRGTLVEPAVHVMLALHAIRPARLNLVQPSHYVVYSDVHSRVAVLLCRGALVEHLEQLSGKPIWLLAVHPERKVRAHHHVAPEASSNPRPAVLLALGVARHGAIGQRVCLVTEFKGDACLAPVAVLPGMDHACAFLDAVLIVPVGEARPAVVALAVECA